MSKTWAIRLSIALIVVILLPIHKKLRGHRGDSFPLSWYPMFSRPRPALEPVDYVIGVTAEGTRHIVHSRHHVGGPMNRARRQLNRLGKRAKNSKTLCEGVAEKFSRRRRGTMSKVVQVWFVRGRFNLKEYFGDNTQSATKEKILWACQVPGRAVFRVPERGEVYRYGESK